LCPPARRGLQAKTSLISNKLESSTNFGMPSQAPMYPTLLSQHTNLGAADVPFLSPHYFCREWNEDGQLWVQYVSSTPATRLDVINLQEELDRKLQQRQVHLCFFCCTTRGHLCVFLSRVQLLLFPFLLAPYPSLFTHFCIGS
jgi:hypothetical protein